MKIYRISQSIIQAYHGTVAPFDKFDKNFSTQGGFWFSEDINKIKNQESGAVSSKYIVSVNLLVDKTVGWEEYDRYFLQQIEDDGFDSINLDDNWIIFDPNRIKIKEWYRIKRWTPQVFGSCRN
ncbi:unnamed protein product [marine sediment metagenome]|uniref:Uncharacterized protein n=1 Tax=marine sediment metagenome TaxID=412755 RepID=X0Z0C2_9ZZZZ